MWKMYKHDLTEGIGRRSVYLVLPVMISLFSCIGMHYKLVQFQRINEKLGNGTGWITGCILSREESSISFLFLIFLKCRFGGSAFMYSFWSV